ncbi:hypothetical protein [Paenibacillus crassostreae]|uniref:Uncharacterized protein n=1 Tax=Paenibacillus crassostreae TaxID=1763538 RepID=A0A167FML8_9BACL|nr:hypothetical protein [Paenibacillus crassostreae]OAB76715.1 hypothetical protein PNBC_04760 [Paenibacillus crassostreae]
MEPWIIIIMLGAAAFIYGIMLPRNKADKTSTELLLKEVEATLEQYMADIEEENDSLVELVGQMKKDSTTKLLLLEEQLIEMKQRLLKVEGQSLEYENRIMEIEQNKNLLNTPLTEIASTSEDLSELSLLEIVDENSKPMDSIKQRYSEVFELYEQGKSMDVIGKLVGIQLGEVQLILQLAKQEGSL